MNTKITELFGIKYPLIQAGMVWVSGYKLAAAVSNAGGLGIIGAGSMYPNVLLEHIKKCKQATDKPFAINIPLFYPDLEEIIKIVIEQKIKIVFTSAGNPKLYTKLLQENGIKVVHVVSSVKFALKSQDAGVDAVVAEGFEAGGHNGREETTTFTLLPMVKKEIDIPLIAAGGIATGRGMLAARVLGADAVQIGSRFVTSFESSAHDNFKQEILKAKDGDTILTLKELIPARLLKNKFYRDLENLYKEKASVEDIKNHLGRARAKLGMFQGDLEEGELEIGQIAGLIDEIKSAKDIVHEIVSEYNFALSEFSALKL